MSNYDPLDLRGQEKTEAERKLRDKLLRENEETDIKWLVSTKRGRRIVWRMLEQAGVFKLSFNTNSMMMAFNEGNRNAGNRLLATVQECSPESIVLMMKEAKSDDEKVQ